MNLFEAVEKFLSGEIDAETFQREAPTIDLIGAVLHLAKLRKEQERKQSGKQSDTKPRQKY